MIAIAIKRRIYFIAKKELFEKKFRRPFLEPLGIFPVNRGTADMQAFRRAITILNNGNGLLVFSQGTRMKEFKDFKRGAALFALKTGTCIIPAGISGSYRLFSTVHVRIGEPVSMEPHQSQKIKSDLVDKVMDEVVARVKRLAL
jgi:1-acyl-sn-glycerol-3-phosphate acyltransferase